MPCKPSAPMISTSGLQERLREQKLLVGRLVSEGKDASEANAKLYDLSKASSEIRRKTHFFRHPVASRPRSLPLSVRSPASTFRRLGCSSISFFGFGIALLFTFLPELSMTAAMTETGQTSTRWACCCLTLIASMPARTVDSTSVSVAPDRKRHGGGGRRLVWPRDFVALATSRTCRHPDDA